MPRPKAPRNTFWRGKVLWAKVRVANRVHRFSLGTDHPGTAAARVRAFRERQIALTKFGDARHTWQDALKSWGERYEIERPFSPLTYDRYLVSLGQVAPYLDGKHIDEIDKAQINAVVAERRRKGIRVATIRRDLTAIASVLAYCVDMEWRTDNPARDKVGQLKETRAPIILPDRTHVELVAARAPGLFAEAIRFALTDGCREEEIFAAERQRLDHARRQLTVIGKRNKRRTFELSPEGYATLQRLPARLQCRFLFWHGDGKRFKNVASRFRGFVLSVAAAAQKSGTEFRPFRFHDLRHLFAVDYLKNGGNIYILQGKLGHSSVKTTEMYLEFLTPEEALAAKFGRSASAQNAAQERRSDLATEASSD